jgi:hypothetical protein
MQRAVIDCGGKFFATHRVLVNHIDGFKMIAKMLPENLVRSGLAWKIAGSFPER